MKVLLVDDHKLFLDGLAGFLTVGGVDVVGTASDGFEALSKARELHPDIVVMDIQMPHCDGFAATRLIKSEMPKVKVIILTMVETDALLFKASNSGADGFVLKNLDGNEFMAILNQYAHAETAPSLDCPEYQHRENLTPRQIQILTLVAAGMKYKEIGTVLNLSERTIKYHMNEIIMRLHLNSRNEAIAFARKIGL